MPALLVPADVARSINLKAIPHRRGYNHRGGQAQLRRCAAMGGGEDLVCTELSNLGKILGNFKSPASYPQGGSAYYV